ncbi:MAG: hypothetical protein HZB55_01845 [Deltaproteobacteria bacterium]|nr:hypothetical protein [Deltaproteobacteria bacterium]
MVLVLALASVFARGGLAAEARPVWMQGFPLRAGAQVLLMWEPFPGAVGYRVVRKDLSTGEEVSRNVATTQQVDTEARPDRSYAYTVQVILQGESPGSVSEVRRLLGVRPLEAPRGVQSYQEASSVRLVWEPVEGAVFYNVYRNGAEEHPVLITSAQETKFADNSLEGGATYVYRIRSVGQDGRESPDSSLLTVTVRSTQAAGKAEPYVRRYVQRVSMIRQGLGYRLREPTDISFSKGTLFVTDLGSRSVLVFAPEGDLLYQFATMPPEYAGAWGIPWGLSVSPDGLRVAVTFLRSSNVRVFSRDGKLLHDVAVGKAPGFQNCPDVPQPMDVVFDVRGDLWVTEYAYAQVVHLGRDGKEIGRVGSPRQSETPGPFRNPTFLAFDAEAETLYVADSLRSVIFGVAYGGDVTWIWNRPRGSEGAMYLPKGLAVWGKGRLLVVDGLTSSLQSFHGGGHIEGVYYSENRQYLDLRGMVSVDADPATGDIYALSKVDSAVYRLKVVREEQAE